MGSPVSSLVGCQSMGCMRSSKEFDFPSFHFRMIVQIIATPPTTDAITIRTVVVVFCIAAFFCVTSLGTAEAAASTELVTRTTSGVEVVMGGTLANDVVGKTAEMDDNAEVEDEDDEGTERTLLDDDEMLAVATLSVVLVGETVSVDDEGELGLLGGVTDGEPGAGGLGGATGFDGDGRGVAVESVGG
jgi:hypothetical protein